MVAFWATRTIARANKLLAWTSVAAGMVGAALTSPIEVVQNSLLLPAEIRIVRNATGEGEVQAREQAELRARQWRARLTGAHAFGLAHFAPKEMPVSETRPGRACGTHPHSLDRCEHDMHTRARSTRDGAIGHTTGTPHHRSAAPPPIARQHTTTTPRHHY